MTSNLNKSIAAVLAVVIIASVGVYIYVNLPQQESSNNNENGGPSPPSELPILTVISGKEQINYTLAQLEALPSYTGRGGYRTRLSSIRGVGNYTGVKVETLVNSLRDIPTNYSIIVYASDGKNNSYNHSIIVGNVDRYNPDNASDETPIGNGGLTMVLAYKNEGVYLNESIDGQLKIVFLDDTGSITSSGLWWKFVESIHVIPEQNQ